MKVKFLVDGFQVEDMAPWDKEKGRLTDSVLKVGDTISFDPSVSIDDIAKISLSKTNEKKLELKENTKYEISGKICCGFVSGSIYLVIDCGIPIRVSIKNPIEYKMKPIIGITGELIGHRGTAIKKPKGQIKKFTFKEGDFISFSSEIKAMWVDTWEGIIHTTLKGRILEREKQGNRNLILTVNCGSPFKPLVEYDPYYTSGKALTMIDETHNSFTVEY